MNTYEYCDSDSTGKKYKYYDTDITGEAEYDITDEAYKELIRTCCKYCSTFSLIRNHSDCSFPNELEPFRVPKDDRIPFVYGHYGSESDLGTTDIRYYHVCPELQETLLKISNSIFSWVFAWGYTNPEDPTFYREDGSIFFSSVIHEGECALFPAENEDIDCIIKNSHWNLFGDF